MKIKNILLLLSLFFILILIFLSQTATNKETGKISEIEYSDNKITIILEDKAEKLIIFDNKFLDLKKGNKISFEGKKDLYKNKKQIIIEKIYCLDCNK
jgi:DNA/RNA endonuclease YhcR with UshA esterase domain|tara:strand:- start:555 stop:848 length:294 start_codon:yes stop_codon:yes gene_type:complete